MKRFFNLKSLLIALSVLAFATLIWAGTVSEKPYGIATPYWYSWTSSGKSTYYLEHPTLTANDQVVVEGVAQTLTNKTLTSPIITGPTISGTATLTGALTNNVLQTAEHGAGAIGTAFAPRTYRRTENGHIITEIHIDLTGLKAKGTAALDAIGLTGAAYIGRYVVATYGIVYKAELICLELPAKASGTVGLDIDIAADDENDIAYDGAVDGGILIDGGAQAAGQVVEDLVQGMTADDYIYIVEGGGHDAADCVYNAGQLIIRFYGHAVIS